MWNILKSNIYFLIEANFTGCDGVASYKFKVVLSKLKDENGGKVYQGSELYNFKDSTIKVCQDQALVNLKSLDDRMHSHLEWSDADLMRSIFFFLDTQSWQLQVAEESLENNCLSEVKAALVSITDMFRAPLKARHINTLQAWMKLKILLSMPGLT